MKRDDWWWLVLAFAMLKPTRKRITGIDWVPYFIQLGGAAMLPYLARWMEKESGGDPCATGAWGGPWEAGIGQIYFERRDQRVYGVTLDELRDCCEATDAACKPSDASKRANASSLIAMAKDCIGTARRALQRSGLTWEEGDVLSLAKLQHNLPVLITYLGLAAQDGMARDWDSFRAYIGGMTRAQAEDMDRRAGYEPTRREGASRYHPLDRLFVNAQYVGRGN